MKKTFIELDAQWEGTTTTAELDLDPWIVTAGIGYRFNLFGPKEPEYGPLK